MEPTLKVLKRLFAVSSNRCAYPKCASPIIEEDSGTPTGVICHIKARSQGGPRYDPQQTDEARHSFSNLILLCARHSKLIDSEPQRYTVDVLLKMKEAHTAPGTVEVLKSDSQKAELLLNKYRIQYDITAAAHANVMIDSPGGVQGQTIVIKNSKRTLKIDPPKGSLGSDLPHLNYVKHLIDQFNELAKYQPKRQFSYAMIYVSIRRRYGANWNFIPLRKFDDLVSYLQKRIDDTMVGRLNRAKRTSNYSTFQEYRQKYMGVEVK